MLTFRELADAWERRRERVAPITKATKVRARAIVREIGDMPLDADQERWLDWIGSHRAKGSAPSTITGRLVTALSIARQARIFLRDKIDPQRVPVEIIEQARDYARIVKASGPSRTRHRSATPEELNALIRAAQNRRGHIRLEVLIPFAVATALRRSEMLKVTWGDFDRNTATLMIRRRKDPRRGAQIVMLPGQLDEAAPIPGVIIQVRAPPVIIQPVSLLDRIHRPGGLASRAAMNSDDFFAHHRHPAPIWSSTVSPALRLSGPPSAISAEASAFRPAAVPSQTAASFPFVAAQAVKHSVVIKIIGINRILVSRYAWSCFACASERPADRPLSHAKPIPARATIFPIRLVSRILSSVAFGTPCGSGAGMLVRPRASITDRSMTPISQIRTCRVPRGRSTFHVPKIRAGTMSAKRQIRSRAVVSASPRILRSSPHRSSVAVPLSYLWQAPENHEGNRWA